MCGIVGLHLRNPELEPRLGELLARMLGEMQDRGADSAGIAVYGNDAWSPAGHGCVSVLEVDVTPADAAAALTAAVGQTVEAKLVDETLVISAPVQSEELLAVVKATYPDALVVQCHRPAETIMASMCSLAQHTTAGWSNTFTGNVIGADSLETWSRGLRLFDAERAKHDPAQFYDLDYGALVSDPVAAVADIYRHFGIELTDDARAAICTRCPRTGETLTLCMFTAWGERDRAMAQAMVCRLDMLAALKDVVRLSDRKHEAWDRAKEVIAAAEGRA